MTKSAIIFIISLVATAGSITGNIFINHKRKVGFIIWSISNVLWILVNCIGIKNIPQIGMFAVYIILNFIGFIKWSKTKTKK